MKKSLKLIAVFIVSLCFIPNVHAATKQELIDYASKTFTVAGKSISSPELAAIVKSYLADNEISSEKADQIIAKGNKIIEIMNTAGTTDLTKLSSSQKNEIRTLATDAATLAGATINYDNTSKRVVVKGSNGKTYGSAPITNTKLAATGSDYTIYIAVSGLALVVASSAAYRKLKNNA
ncbi:MAG: hypothetical protein SO108_07065 [Bacilli bacterium]|nr:hypothetical protein [Bacilli bacterium]